MGAQNAEMIESIVEDAVKIAEKYGVSIENTKAAEQLISVVGSHVTNKRRQEEFFGSTIRPNESAGR